MTSDLLGKTFVITGANAGIGRASAAALARRGGRVVICGRSLERTRPVLEAIAAESAARADGGGEVAFVTMDLTSLASVRDAALEVLEREPRIDVLVDNAGIAGHRGLTEDGFEIQFGVNHVGHHLFTRLLLPRLVASAPSRVVVVSSGNHTSVKTDIDYDAVRRPTRTRVALHEYDVSKLANVLFAKELARRYEAQGVSAYSLNPGRVATDVWRRIPWPFRPIWKAIGRMKTEEEGAKTILHCATADAAALENGGYYEDERRARENPIALDAERARVLWETSEAWVKDVLPPA